MTAVIPNRPPKPPAVRRRALSQRGGKVPGPACPPTRPGPGITRAETGRTGDWGRVWAATEKHCRTLRHYPLFRAEPAGGGR